MDRYRTEIEKFKTDMKHQKCFLIFEDNELIVHQKGAVVFLNPKYKMLEKSPRTIVDEKNCFSLYVNQLTSIMANLKEQ